MKKRNILFTVTAIAAGAYWAVEYNRSIFGPWQDVDGDCQNTRAEVLIDSSRGKVALSPDGCRAIHGLWFLPYSAEIETDASKIDIDHLVPLKEYWISHGDRSRTKEFANDWDNLIPVSASENRKKGARGPDEYKPKDKRFWCEYAMRWYEVKKKYKLTLDAPEVRALTDMLDEC